VFRKYLAKNYVGINADGTTKRTSEVTEMQNTDLRNYSFTDMKVVFPKAGVAVVTYKPESRAAPQGRTRLGPITLQVCGQGVGGTGFLSVTLS
jgi:hypothetical protein